MRRTTLLILVVWTSAILAVSQVTPDAGKSPLAAAAPASGPSTPTVPTANTSQRGVRIMFTATDSNGGPIRDISKEQVTVIVNEQAGQVLDVQSASDVPLDLAIVLLSSKDKFNQEQAAAIELVQKVIRPGKDRAFVVTARGEKPWPNPRVNWSTDLAALAQTIRDLDKGAGLPDAFTYEVKIDASHLDRMYTQPIATPPGFTFFNVIFAMMQTDPRPVRKAVVLFRTPMAHAPGWGARSSELSDQTHAQIIGIAQGMGIAFYTVGSDEQVAAVDAARADLGSSYTPIHSGAGGATRVQDQSILAWKNEQFNAGRSNVERLANESGGRAYWTSKKNYSDAIAGIVNELAGRYVLIFAPPDVSSGAKGPGRPVKVQVARAAHVSVARMFVVPEKKLN